MEKRNCQNCGEELIKRNHESINRYSKKKYCTSKCARVKLKEERRGWWDKEYNKDKFYMKEVN